MMKRSCLFIYSHHYGDFQEVWPILDAMEEILNWRYELPNTFFLVSELNAEELSQRLISTLSNKGRFLISEYSPHSQGLLTKEGWEILNNKEMFSGNITEDRLIRAAS